MLSISKANIFLSFWFHSCINFHYLFSFILLISSIFIHILYSSLSFSKQIDYAGFSLNVNISDFVCDEGNKDGEEQCRAFAKTILFSGNSYLFWAKRKLMTLSSALQKIWWIRTIRHAFPRLQLETRNPSSFTAMFVFCSVLFFGFPFICW